MTFHSGCKAKKSAPITPLDGINGTPLAPAWSPVNVTGQVVSMAFMPPSFATLR